MSAPSTLAIEASGLEKSFGTSRAVCGVDLAVRRGSVYGILGPNGAGKTTTIKMLATLVRPDAGEARVLGHDIVRDADAVRGAISLTGQLASVDEDLTGEENLILLARLLGYRHSRAKARAGELLEAFDLADGAGRLVKGYSGGMRRRLDIAASIIVTPGTDVSGRADHGTRPALAQPGLGHRPRPRRRRHDDPALHAVPGRGRPAGRRNRRHRPRPHDRGGHPSSAEGLGRLGRAPRPPARRRPASRRCGHPLRRSRPTCTSSRAPRRCRPRAPTPTRPPRPSPSCPARASGSPRSRSASQPSTRSSSH
jgi:ABC-type branched-subunit amino acid transport system ATPase component